MTDQPDESNFLIGKLTAKIDLILEMLRDHRTITDRLETRLRSLEDGRAWLVGAAAAAAFIASGLAWLIGALFL